MSEPVALVVLIVLGVLFGIYLLWRWKRQIPRPTVTPWYVRLIQCLFVLLFCLVLLSLGLYLIPSPDDSNRIYWDVFFIGCVLLLVFTINGLTRLLHEKGKIRQVLLPSRVFPIFAALVLSSGFIILGIISFFHYSDLVDSMIFIGLTVLIAVLQFRAALARGDRNWP